MSAKNWIERIVRERRREGIAGWDINPKHSIWRGIHW